MSRSVVCLLCVIMLSMILQHKVVSSSNPSMPFIHHNPATVISTDISSTNLSYIQSTVSHEMNLISTANPKYTPHTYPKYTPHNNTPVSPLVEVQQDILRGRRAGEKSESRRPGEESRTSSVQLSKHPPSLPSRSYHPATLLPVLTSTTPPPSTLPRSPLPYYIVEELPPHTLIGSIAIDAQLVNR